MARAVEFPQDYGGGCAEGMAPGTRHASAAAAAASRTAGSRSRHPPALDSKWLKWRMLFSMGNKYAIFVRGKGFKMRGSGDGTAQ